MTNKELLEIAKRERLWLTAEEFYTVIEARKAACLKKEPVPRKPLQHGPFAKDYWLRIGGWEFTPKVKAPIARKPEVMP